jgi:YHS domain-containing protein
MQHEEIERNAKKGETGMRTIPTILVISLALSGCFTGAAVGDGPTRNALAYLTSADQNGVILGGHDPVAFFTENKPVMGSEAHQAQYMGATYHFASAANRDAFLANPAHYAPQFGAFCSMAVSMGKLEPTEISTFSIVDGRLLFQRNEKAMKMWRKDVKGNLERADSKWPGLVAKAPAAGQ